MKRRHTFLILRVALVCLLIAWNPLILRSEYIFLGLLSREIAPNAKQIVGIDISQGMVDQYNRRVANQGISPDEMKAICVDLKGVDGELDNRKFDVVVVRH